HWHLQLAAPANLLDWRSGVSDFEDVTGYFEGVSNATLTGRGEPQVLKRSTVMGNFFATLGVRPARGRTFTFDETWARSPQPATPGDRGQTSIDARPSVAILSDAAWH